MISRAGFIKRHSHLLIMNCDLRVLVAYPDDDDDDGEEQLKHLHCKSSKETDNHKKFLMTKAF